MRVLALSGSLQTRSANAALLQAAVTAAPEGVQIVVFDGLRELPPFNPEACPEYAFSLPGALKNAIDWVIGTGELERKIVGVTAAVSHPDRGRRGLRALSEPLRLVSARIVGGDPIVRGPSFDAEVQRGVIVFQRGYWDKLTFLRQQGLPLPAR
jgi:chromate reductase, NAD(P)H dehydrogenase (quinone)